MSQRNANHCGLEPPTSRLWRKRSTNIFSQISIRFIDIDNRDNCDHDYIEIWEPHRSHMRYCDIIMSGDGKFITQGNQVFIYSKYDENVEVFRYGWTLLWSAREYEFMIF